MELPVKYRIRRSLSLIILGMVLAGGAGTVVSWVDSRPDPAVILFAVIGGALMGVSIGYCENVLVPSWGRTGTFRRLTTRRFLFYSLTIISALFLINVSRLWLWEGMPLLQTPSFYFFDSGIRDFGIGLAASFFVTIAVQLAKLHSISELWQLLSGKYHTPVTEHRLFLFIDLEGSTSLAERLGPTTYSYFIRDVFAEIDPIIATWKGTIYQYLGDGVIISWLCKGNFDFSVGLKCFQEIRFGFSALDHYYRDEYSCSPTFRAGIHSGKVVVTRVGTSSTSFAMHGDALNVTARLQSMCSENLTDLVISEVSIQESSIPKGMKLQSIGDVTIRGRSDSQKILILIN